jgi:hypothetical protein
VHDQLTAQQAVQRLAPARAMTPDNVKHRSIGLVVHGIGEQPQGSTLQQVASEFLPLARHRFNDVGIALTPLDDPAPHEARIWFKEAGGEKTEIRFLEVWYADCFNAISMGNFITGTRQFIQTIFFRKKRRRLTWAGNADPGPHSFINAATFLQRAFIELVGIALLIPAFVLVLLPLWLLEKVGVLSLLPAFVSRPARAITNVCTRQLGDMWVYMRDPWNSARIRVRFEERFYQMLQILDDDPEKDNVESVFVVAHSMGSVVAYEALTGSRISTTLDRFHGGRSHDHVNEDKRPTFHFISVGSALNLAWAIAPDEELCRFTRPMARHVKWLNIYGTQDPVACGRLELPIGADPSHAKVWADRNDRLRQTAVINQMDIFSDHTAYWNNAEEVIAPMLDVFTSGRLDKDLCMNVAERRKRVSWLALFKLGAWMVAPVAFAIVVTTGAGNWLSSWAAFGYLDQHAWQRWALTPLVWSGACGAGAAVLYSSVVKMAWNTTDERHKYDHPR